jgi:pyruvate dehydrogenase E2 component (dihydrolipoamide acetyltransferase)
MSESVNLPALGESVTEGTVTRWLKSVGDTVEVDEPLLEVSTDKVDTEIPSPVSGVIEEILVQEDETVDVGTPLVRIGDGSGGGQGSATPEPEQEAQPAAQATESVAQAEAPAPAAPQPATPAPQPAAAPAPQPAPAAAPAPQAAPAQQPPAPEQAPLAQDAVPSPEVTPGNEQRSDLGQSPQTPAPVPETAAQAAPPQPAPDHTAVQPAAEAEAAAAPSGDTSSYITPIVRKLAHERGVDLGSLKGSGVGGRIRKEDVLAAAEKPSAAAAAPAPKAVEVSPLRGTTVKMSRLRKVVAERAVVSMQTSAQLTSVVEVDVTRVAQFRDKVKGQFLEKTGTKLSFLPFFALAAAEALKSFPIINATVDGDSIVYPDTENISIAVDTERGLLTPVVRDAGSLDLAGLSAQIADLAARTRNNKLKPDELAGGTFTLTNTGSRGALFDTPLVFLPQVAILGTGIVVKRPVVVNDGVSEAIAIRSMVYLALSYDHRIVDGADAARFLVQVKNRLEEGAFADSLGI